MGPDVSKAQTMCGEHELVAPTCSPPDRKQETQPSEIRIIFVELAKVTVLRLCQGHENKE